MLVAEVNTVMFEHAEKDLKVCLILYENREEFEGLFCKEVLSEEEKSYLKRVNSIKRAKEYYLGRFWSKKAIQEYTGVDETEFPKIAIVKNVFGFPVLKNNPEGIEVSIAHQNDYVGAIVHPNQIMMGLDIENYVEIRPSITLVADEDEKKLKPPDMDEKMFCTILWTCKEAIGKCLKVGIGTGISQFKVSNIEVVDGVFYISFSKYPQMSAICKQWKDSIYAFAYPKKLHIKLWDRKEINHEI